MGAGGGGAYVAGAVHFDGATAAFTMDLLGATISPRGTFFCWFKTVAYGDNYSLATSADDVSGVFPDGHTPMNYYTGKPGYPTSDTYPYVMQLRGSTTLNGFFDGAVDENVNTGHWVLAACSWETDHTEGAKVCQILIDGVLKTVTVGTDDQSFSSPWGPGFIVGAYTGMTEGWQGDISDFYLDITTNVDLSDPLVVAMIISGGKPVYQGDDGALLTGVRPIIYLAGDAATYAANKGSGGAFTWEGTPTDAADGPSDDFPAVSDAVHFIGDTSYLSKGSAIAAASGVFSYSSFRRIINDSATGLFFGPGGLTVNPDGSASLVTYGTPAGHIAVEWPADSVPLGVWTHILLSVDTDHAAGDKTIALYVDDVYKTPSAVTDDDAAFEVDWLSNDTFSMNYDGSTGAMTDAAHDWFAPGVSLLTGSTIAQVDRRKFITAGGKPADPSGYPASAVLFNGDAATYPVNQGSGGTFTLHGSVVPASTSPSD